MAGLAIPEPIVPESPPEPIPGSGLEDDMTRMVRMEVARIKQPRPPATVFTRNGLPSRSESRSVRWEAAADSPDMEGRVKLGLGGPPDRLLTVQSILF